MDLEGLLRTFGPTPNVVIHSGCSEPPLLARLLAEEAAELKGTRLFTLMPMGVSPYATEASTAHIDVETFFPGVGLRTAFGAGRVRPLRYPLSTICSLFDRGELRADAIMVQVAPPDETGHVSLGLSVDYMRSVLSQSPTIIAEINPHMPHTCGDTLIPASDIDWYVDSDTLPQGLASRPADIVDVKIAQNIAGLVRDGAVLQIGIGSLPDRVLSQLGHLKHLGIHSGVISDGIWPLIESGIVDNATKKRFRGVCVTAMACGTHPFYEFLDRNPSIEFHSSALTHNRDFLASIDNLCAINSGLQVELSGNVTAESVRGRRISMPGGLPDFAAGASRSEGGISIVGIGSAFADGRFSNIVMEFPDDVPVTVPSSDVDFVVTEWGVASLRNRDAAERAAAMIAIAHPDHREQLERDSRQRKLARRSA